MTRFVVGQGLSWSSQAQGSSKSKTGLVVEVVAAGARPIGIPGAGFSRNHESYVVEVPQGRNAKPKKYWPIVSGLQQAHLSEIGLAARRANPGVAEMKAAIESSLPGVSVWRADDGAWFVTRKPVGEGETEEAAVLAAYTKLRFVGASLGSPRAHERDIRQAEFVRFAIEAFGERQTHSIPQRGIRLMEEADEAGQAAGVTREMAHKLVDFVWDRPMGELSQELGGVGVTVLALASAAGLSADAAEVTEIERILAKPLAHFAQRNEEKNAAGFLVADLTSKTAKV
jgi:hypothetical protein